jgi:hypothetical protein
MAMPSQAAGLEPWERICKRNPHREHAGKAGPDALTHLVNPQALALVSGLLFIRWKLLWTQQQEALQTGHAVFFDHE